MPRSTLRGHRLQEIPHMLRHMVSKRSAIGKRAPRAQASEASGEFATPNLRSSAALRRKSAKTLPEQKTEGRRERLQVGPRHTSRALTPITVCSSTSTSGKRSKGVSGKRRRSATWLSRSTRTTYNHCIELGQWMLHSSPPPRHPHPSPPPPPEPIGSTGNHTCRYAPSSQLHESLELGAMGSGCNEWFMHSGSTAYSPRTNYMTPRGMKVTSSGLRGFRLVELRVSGSRSGPITCKLWVETAHNARWSLFNDDGTEDTRRTQKVASSTHCKPNPKGQRQGNVPSRAQHPDWRSQKHQRISSGVFYKPREHLGWTGNSHPPQKCPSIEFLLSTAGLGF